MHSYKLFTALIFLITIGRGQSRFEFQHHQMGTQIRLVFYARDQRKADSVSQAAFARIDALNHTMSDYLEDSELRKLGAKSRIKVAVSDDLFKVLRAALQVSSQTSGAFDISAGPYVALWRKARITRRIPTADEIKEARHSVGYRHITLSEKNSVRLDKKGMALDLGGIGKGFAADEVMKILKLSGINSALVDMGGDILVSESPPEKLHWTLAFSYFDKDGVEIMQKIKLQHQAAATSGDVFQFVEIDGVRYSHIIDPRSGVALKNGVQVTVIAPSATVADAYASAYSVMGVEAAQFNIGKSYNLEVFMVEHTKTYYNSWMSRGFADYMSQ